MAKLPDMFTEEDIARLVSATKTVINEHRVTCSYTCCNYVHHFIHAQLYPSFQAARHRRIIAILREILPMLGVERILYNGWPVYKNVWFHWRMDPRKAQNRGTGRKRGLVNPFKYLYEVDKKRHGK